MNSELVYADAEGQTVAVLITENPEIAEKIFGERFVEEINEFHEGTGINPVYADQFVLTDENRDFVFAVANAKNRGTYTYLDDAWDQVVTAAEEIKDRLSEEIAVRLEMHQTIEDVFLRTLRGERPVIETEYPTIQRAIDLAIQLGQNPSQYHQPKEYLEELKQYAVALGAGRQKEITTLEKRLEKRVKTTS